MNPNTPLHFNNDRFSLHYDPNASNHLHLLPTHQPQESRLHLMDEKFHVPHFSEFGLSSTNHHSHKNNSHSGLGASGRVAKVISKETDIKIPEKGKLALVAASAASTAHTWHKRSKEEEAAGNNSVEGHTCALVATTAQEIVNKGGKAGVELAFTGYFRATVVNPPLMGFSPVVGAALPEAVARIEQAGEKAGNAADDLCHSAFAASKSIPFLK